MLLTVVICTFNPNLNTLYLVLNALKGQSIPLSAWELLIIDNNSTTPLEQILDLSWHPIAKIIREEKPGLSYARVKGVTFSKSELIVFVDDDNLLDKNFLQQSYEFYKNNPQVGCFGGRSLPVFETTPPDWFKDAGIKLGCQDFGNEPYISDYSSVGFKLFSYPEKAPIGTGMVIQKKAFVTYLQEVDSDEERMKLGRKGQLLSSGEDNDIILTIIKKGYEIAYVPKLLVHHMIPLRRYSIDYLQKMAFESNKSWVKVLAIHNLCQWKRINKWTYGLRKMKSYLKNRAWQSPQSSIQWYKSCGKLKGLSEI